MEELTPIRRFTLSEYCFLHSCADVESFVSSSRCSNEYLHATPTYAKFDTTKELQTKLISSLYHDERTYIHNCNIRSALIWKWIEQKLRGGSEKTLNVTNDL